jgi:DNA (cytosine-5)-methyltransferase 1
MTKPRLLDLFCCAGGAAMGYHRAGFEVVGVDIKPQPHYPFEFHQADALTYPLDGFDAIHASPPCQAYSCLRVMPNAGKHPRLVEPVRERLQATGKPFVIENVPGAPLLNAFTLCGSSFGLQTPKGYGLRRHRKFETNVQILFIPPCQHSRKTVGLFGDKARDTGQEKRHYAQDKETRGFPVGVAISQQDGLIAMGCEWMTIKEACQAIPPAYTEFIGKYLMQEVLK